MGDKDGARKDGDEPSFSSTGCTSRLNEPFDGGKLSKYHPAAHEEEWELELETRELID